ncbi:MAG TPA: lysophospholipid acyltransferase family protein [Blastocatellia bacterium]|nr:lysophospholipid acyltransferase family protein [Blastocatellia bacterium]
MIRARHSPVFAAVFARYAKWLLRRHFRAVYVSGSLPDTRSPLLVAAQHVAWWDPIVLFHLSRTRFSGVHYAMMGADNLRRLAYFGRLGAFGLDRRHLAGSLKYACARLAEPFARVWIFPQGEAAPADARPIVCERGGDWLASRARVPVVPVALRYDFGDDRLPTAYLRFGAPRMVEHDGDVEAMLNRVAVELANDVHTGRLSSYDKVLDGRRSISDRFAGRIG